MKRIRTLSRGVHRLIGLAAVTIVAGCAAAIHEPQPPCCYDGAVTLGHVSNLQLALEDGRRLRFDEVFSGYAPQEGLFADALPFLEADIGLVTYQALQAVFPAYDTNDNGHLETPELTLLYLSEVAGGLGYPVRAIHNESSSAGSTAGRVFALVLSQSELGGLIEFAKSRQSQLSDRARKILVELDRLGQEILNDADGPDQSGDLIIKI